MDELSFRGIKFWVSKSVPKTITLDIRKRHGEIVILEREADICLANHNAYVSYPDKHYSYLWVQECLSRNAKVDESRFLVSELRKNLPAASPSVAAPSAVPDPAPESYAASQLVKGRKLARTPFTNEDDQILIDWLRTEGCLVDGSKNGLSGNEVYKRLEKKYPHHTFHSWRDRWVKKLSRVVSLETLTGHGSVAASEPAPAPLVARQSRAAPPAQARAARPPVHDLGGNEKIPFLTTMDLAIIRATWREALAGEQKTPAAFFEALAAKNPSVSAESWRARYMRLRAWYAKIDVFDQEEDRPSHQPAPDPQPVRTTNTASGVNQAAGASRRRGGGNGNGNGDDDDNDDDDDEGGYDDTSFDAAALLNEVSAQDEAERRFYGDVDFFNSMGGGYYIPRAFIIGGRLLDIWTLWTAVQEVAPDPDDRDWDRVVETLDFDTAKHPAIRQELEFWYSHNMADLEEARADFEADEADVALPTQTRLSAGAKRRLHEAFGEDDSDADDGLADSPADKAATSSANKRSRASEIPPPSDCDGSSFQLHPFVPAAAAAPARSAAMEPETQDFAYGRATHSTEEDDADEDADEDASSADLGVPATPSQQLQTEIQTMEAVPLSLGRSSLGPSSETVRRSASASQADSRRSLPAWFGRGRVPESQTDAESRRSR